MKRLLIGGNVWRSDHTFAQNMPILLEDDRIIAVGEECSAATADEICDVTGMFVLPGLLDVHTHGRCGCDFCNATEEEMRMMKEDYARHGVTSVMASLASDTKEGWEKAIARIEACGFLGVHLEGRYLNPAKKGAHAIEFLSSLDADDLERVLKMIHLPCHVTAAYELDADGSFAAKALEYGATLGLGHTCATAEETKTAIRRGVTSFTHLFNAMPPLHHREGGAVAVALNGGGYGELIVDGVHLCPDMVRLAYRCLGKDKTVLITDSMAGTGCPDGEYSIAGLPVIVKDGRALTMDGVIAGSTLDLWQGVRNLMVFADVSFADAVACATINPARMVGVENAVGSLDVGKRADLLLVNSEKEICRVICGGKDLS